MIWDIATSLQDSHRLLLPPLYTNKEHLEKILGHASNELLQRELLKVFGDSSNCGHFVIGGVEVYCSQGDGHSCALLLS